MPWTTLRRPARVAAFCVLAWPEIAAAQGHGNAFGHYKASPTSRPASGGSAEAQVPIVDLRNFGAWLDDATVLPNRSGFVSFGVGLWRMPGFREFDAPVVDSGISLTRRVQVGISVPYVHAGEPGAAVTSRGLGDVYLNSKIQLRDPSTHRLGFAVTPIVEVLNTASASNGSRMHWALPASVELQRRGLRAYGSGGYFSRGALFVSGAVEAAVSGRAWVTGAVSHSYSMPSVQLISAFEIPHTRTDVSGGASFNLRPDVTLFGSLGRTFGGTGAVMLSGGVTLNFRR